jgi:SAM-dependent methyltransferase
LTEWFEQWFGEEYLRLYPHRDDAEAAQAVDLVARIAPVDGRRVLDLACGTGRHAARLRDRGARVVGLDLSRPLLARARRRDGAPLTLVRGDMRRLPLRDGAFDLVVNLFTSFGYFTDDAEHDRVLRAAAAVLVPGGWFVLDYLHAECVRERLVPVEELETTSDRVSIRRWVTDDGRSVVKEIHLAGEGRSFTETVRLFTPGQLEEMLGRAGLSVRFRFGGYDGRPLAPAAPRVILAAQKA